MLVKNVVEIVTMVGEQSRTVYFLAQCHARHNVGETLKQNYNGTQMSIFIQVVCHNRELELSKGSDK